MIRCIVEALQHVHDSRCTHRYVGPTTVWINGEHAYLDCPPPEAYQDTASRSADDVLEFAQYASPELAGSIDHDIGPASDLYSVGAVLFTLLAGKPPFQGETVGAILFQHVATEPCWEELGDEIPLVVLELIARLLRKEPRDRYQSAAGVLADLDHILADHEADRPIEWFAIGRHDQRASLVEPAFVGRTAELHLLQQSLDRASRGAGERMGVICPSGIGKSRFVLEVIRDAVRRGFHIYRSLAADDASQQPAAPLISLISQLTARVAKDARCRAAIQRAVADIHSDVAVLFPQLVAALGWNDCSSGNHEELGATRIQTVFARLLAHFAQPDQPALVWIDDCQWLDAQSLAVLEALNQQTARHTVFLFSMRDSEGVTKAFLDRVRLDQQILLQTLSDDEVRALVESMTGPLPDEAIETVVRLAAGSPFMASAVTFGLVETGALVTDSTGWRVDTNKLATLQASSSAASVLLNRLEQLPSSVLGQLTAAAIIGKEFQEQTVAELAGLAYQDSKDGLELARSQRLIWTMPDGRMAFVHDKIREALLDRLNAEERQHYHLRYAEFLQQSSGEHPFELAHHFHAAGAMSRALPYALQAAEAARRLHSLDRAEELLRIAWNGREFAAPDVQLEIGAGLAEVLMLAGKYDESQAWFETALHLVRSATDLARLNLKRGELAFKRGDKELAVQLCSEALAELKQRVPKNNWQLAWLLGRELSVQVLHCLFPSWFVSRRRRLPSESERLTWHLFSRLAYGYWYTRTKFHTMWTHLRNLNLAERYLPTPEMAQAYSEHAPAMSLIPWHSRGIQYAQKSLKIRQDLHDVWGQGQSRNFYSILLYSSSQFDKCIEQATQAESILLRTGDFWEVNIARYQLAASLYRQGKLKEALEAAQRTYEAALAIGDYQSTSNILDVWVRASMGDIPDEILAAEKVRTIRDRQGECQALLAQGVAMFFQEHYVQASECFSQAIGIAERAGVNNAFITPNYAWLVTALRQELLTRPPQTGRARKRDLNRLRRAAKRALRVSRWFQNDLPHALREYGAVCALFGWHKRAQRALRSSMAVAQRQGAAFELALTEKIYGEIGRELAWTDAADVGKRGRGQVREFRQSVHRDARQESIALLDRFDTLLSAGREIVSANSRLHIFANTQQAAQRLLRGQWTLLLERATDSESATWTPIAGGDFVPNQVLLDQMVQTGKTTISGRRGPSPTSAGDKPGSYMCAPITLHGRIVACLYVAHETLANLWGPDEIRIADYLTTSAGAALEKANTFDALQQLNIQLEEKVLERTATVEARSKQLEITAQELLATKVKLEQARDEAESANAAKSQFLARMSHEIRTPISAVIGFTDVLLRGLVKDPRESRRKLQTIHANGNHLLQLINDLLDLSKIEANKMEVEAIDCCPVRILHEVVASLQVRAEEKGIALQFHFDGAVPVRITSDPTRLRQILTNIIGNAIKFTPQGHVATTMRLLGSFDDPAPELEFIIADTGIGMTPEQMAKIFDPFTQADNSVTRKFGGTGLGLSISRQLAEALGGGVAVSSEPGLGSTFSIRIGTGRLSPGDMIDSQTALRFVADEEVIDGIDVDLAGVRVLVVDDTDTNRDLLALILRESGADVELKENGLEAVEWLKDQSVHIVLMDMQMPVMDGYAAATELRKRNFTAPIIALTANSMQGDESKCRDAGCSDYLSKPIDINLLLRKIANWTLREQGAMPAGQSLRGTKSIPLVAPEVESNWLRELPDQEPFREFALELVNKVQKRLEEICTATENGDWATLAQIAHWIKGTGGTVGLFGLSEAARALEEAARAENSQLSQSAADRLRQYVSPHVETTNKTENTSRSN